MLSLGMVQMLVTVGVTGVVLGVLSGITYCRKKNINIDKDIDTVNNIVNTAGPVIDVADVLLPNNPAVAVLKTIEGWAKIAAGNAEELKHAGDINGDQRAAAAEKVVTAVLRELNVEVTDNRKILIDAAIKDTVGSFGHKEPTDAEKEAQLQQLQTEKAQLVSENTNLKNTINTITTAASTVQVEDTTSQNNASNSVPQAPLDTTQNNTIVTQ